MLIPIQIAFVNGAVAKRTDEHMCCIKAATSSSAKLSAEALQSHPFTLFANFLFAHIGTNATNTLTVHKCRVFLAAQQQIIEKSRSK